MKNIKRFASWFLNIKIYENESEQDWLDRQW